MPHPSPDPVELDQALGQSEVFLDFQERLSRVAKIERPVLIVGERGTGKELAAARLHYLSKRWEAPFVTLNCAALSPTLIESELFGHEAGAFTGAAGRRAGRFEAADAGTLFLDEIGLIPVEAQEKILRAVEYGVFERVGSSEPTRVDVRIVGATNMNLAALAEGGRFKRDLLDRLTFEVLALPPLRERDEDIMLLAGHFAARMAYELGWKEMPEFSPEAVETLTRYAWPGNIRELKNVVERAVFRAGASPITGVSFDPFESVNLSVPCSPAQEAPLEVRGSPSPLRPPTALAKHAQSPASFAEAVRGLELRLLREALERSRHNQRKAADALGLSYHQFRGLYRKYKGEIEG